MAIENLGMQDHIRQTIETLRHLDISGDIGLREQFSKMIGDQYEALIGLSVTELQDIASPSPKRTNRVPPLLVDRGL